MNIYFIFGKDELIPADYDLVFNYFSGQNLHYTFWEQSFIPASWYSNIAIDLLYVSISVYAADRLCARDEAMDAWSRDLKLDIPVLDLGIWEENKNLLENMLNYLSGDSWTINFHLRELTEKEKNFKKKWEKQKKDMLKYDRVCMFSGGLDSFIGAIDQLATYKEERILFVSHYGGGKGTKEYQDQLIEQFCKNYNLLQADFQQFHTAIVKGIEGTTRTRSFLFFAHAIALASTFEKDTVLTIPENGLISLNIPSTFSRVGTSSTRTTHPFYMAKLQMLINSIGLNIRLQNPYQFKTKGEMLEECKNRDFMRENIAKTMSCSHPDVGRHRGENHAMHCGYCLPCVIRKAAIKKAGIQDASEYFDANFNRGNEAKICLNSYRQGIKRFEPRYAFMTIQQNGPITDNIMGYTELYIRGMKELEEYIKGIQ